MPRWILGLFLSFLFFLEGAAAQGVLPQAWGSPLVFIPQFAVSGIILLALYNGRYEGLAWGFVFGLLYDIVYGQVIGVHAFSTAVVGYVAGSIPRHIKLGPLVALLVTGLGQAGHLLLTYGWYRLFGITHMAWNEAVFFHVAPSVLFNAAAAFPVYLFMRWLVDRTETRRNRWFH
ncbi:hypothetical protein GCM10011571_20620 [Marinithermofilum abyssi]|uniref:Rod shape-determining protein MreD n=1 Tax=Marinithermofilum abyssi TaxID=1571185 RepID=A0A8J2VG00_9BACL|nr:rod shape-determining protein MreD [Marinithermofilum abyssi]GGE18574.1 hypothetical protein GCM10011571_20620 [Marinithermofilum abyssi]